MESNILDMCSYVETYSELWSYIRELFSGNLSRMYDLSNEYFGLQQGDKSVRDYYAGVKRLHEELNVVLPISNDIKKMYQAREQMAVLKFLAGLKPEFEPVKAQILSGSELPTLDEAYSRVSRAISQKSSINIIPDRSALATQFSQPSFNNNRAYQGNRNDNRSTHMNCVDHHGNSHGNNRSDNRGSRICSTDRGGRGPSRKCSHYGLPNHTIEQCWDLHDKPSYVANNVTVESESISELPKMVNISQEEYSKFQQYQTARQASVPIASYAHKGFQVKEDDWRRA